MSFSPRIVPVILSVCLSVWACFELYYFINRPNTSITPYHPSSCLPFTRFRPGSRWEQLACSATVRREKASSVCYEEGTHGDGTHGRGKSHIHRAAAIHSTTEKEDVTTQTPPLRVNNKKVTVPKFVYDHAPLVHLHSEERYWPGDMQEHLEHVTPKLNYTAISAHSPALDSLDSLNEWERGWSVYLTSNDNPEELPPWLGGEENIPNPYKQDQTLLDEGDSSPDLSFIYGAHQRPLNSLPVPSIVPSEANHLRPGYSPAPAVLVVVEKPDNITDAFWFFFYSFNLGNTVFNVRFGNHVGDWEHTLIRFQHGKPIEAFLSEHNFGSSYTFNALEKHLERDEEAGLEREKSRPVKSTGKWKADRPIVYSGIGTHAMYATPGRHTYVLPFGLLHDETSRGPLWDPTLNLLSYTYSLPSPASPSPSLKPDMKTKPDAPTGWFFFNGHWGDKGYEMEDPRQYEFVGQKHYVSGPVGPRFKALGRKHICPRYEGDCLVRDVRGLEGVRTWRGGDDDWPRR